MRATFSRIRSVLRRAYDSPVYMFIALSVVFGLSSIITIPVFEKNDESANFIRAYGISNGEFYVDRGTGYDSDGLRKDNGTRGTVTMPTSYIESRDCLGIGGSYPWMKGGHEGQNGKPYRDVARVIDCAVSTPLNQGETVRLVGDAAYSPVSYIPQAIAILAGKLFDMPIIGMSYLVRVLNLALWITLVSFAIKLIPRRKWALAFVCLFPSFMFSVAHAAPDATLFGSIAVFIAVIVRSIYLAPQHFNKENKRLVVIMLLAALTMVLAKSSYGVLLLPLLLFYGGLKRYVIAKITAIVLLAIISFAPINNWSVSGGSMVQVSGAKSVLEFSKTIIVQLIKGESVSPGMFSGALVLPALPQLWVIMLASMIVAFVLLIDYEHRYTRFKLAIKRNEKRVLILSGLVIACMVFCGALYLLWQQFGFVRPVPLVPGRYFLSILMLFAVLPVVGKVTSSEGYYKRVGVTGLVLLNVIVTALYVYAWHHPVG